jgi:aerobic carbon-monoxide dehydrogenase medium subunit
MILPRFELAEPISTREVCDILQKTDKVRVIAGGTDLLVNLKKKVFTADTLVSLSQVPDLNGISFSSSSGLTIGSMVRIADLAISPVIAAHYPGLANAAGKLGSPQIRNRATIGGNVCSARPAADMVGPLVAYGAIANIATAANSREERIERIFKGPGQTTLAKGEFLTGFKIPAPAKNTGISYIKYGIRHAMEIALVSVTSLVVIENEKCVTARVVLGAVAPTFIRCPATEEFLEGKAITGDVAEQAGYSASEICTPITDIRGTADYRRQLVRVLTKRTLLEAAGQIK